jgi:hypothetical protein
MLAATLVGVGVLLYLEYRRPSPGRTARWTELSPPNEGLVIQHRVIAKNQLARRIVAERIPLLEAAEMFRQMNGEEGMALVTSVPGGRSVREKLCRQVIRYVSVAETDLENEGQIVTGPRVSDALKDELDRRIAAGEFPPEPGIE